MTTSQFLLTAWSWNPLFFAAGAVSLAAYGVLFRARARFGYFIAAWGAILLALVSPLHALADGYLFSAHMAQHILLLLIAPALALLSLPASLSPGRMPAALTHPLAGWLSGVGAMWLWHTPALCNAAAVSRPLLALQSVSLLVLGTVFWWPVLAPRERRRLPPLGAILYLFTACVACSVLGIIITFSPVRVCSIFMHPVDRLGMMETIRQGWGLTPERDQQIGGLLMWVPMCSIYAAAILAQFARWHTASPLAFPEKTP
jgi:cytochrome c oxidase assembly factor CtaG